MKMTYFKWTMASVLLLLLLSITSCGDDDDVVGSLNLNFQLKYNDQALVMSPTEVDFKGIPFKILRVSFYISEMALTNASASTEILEVDYMDLTESHLTLEDSQKGFNYKINNIPVAVYDGLDFNIGLTEEMNAKEPADYPVESILNVEDEYWRDWSSYIFIKIEGRMDFDGDGEFEQGIAMHLGSNDAGNSRSFDQTIEIVDGQTAELNLEIDIFDVFDQGAEVYDFRSVPQTHSLNFLDEIKFVSSGLANAITLK